MTIPKEMRSAHDWLKYDFWRIGTTTEGVLAEVQADALAWAIRQLERSSNIANSIESINAKITELKK